MHKDGSKACISDAYISMPAVAHVRMYTSTGGGKETFPFLTLGICIQIWVTSGWTKISATAIVMNILYTSNM